MNLVVGATVRVLKLAKVWLPIAEDVTRMKERARPVGRALTEQEKARLFLVAASKPEWAVVYAAALISVNTTMRGGTLKGLRWADVNLFDRMVSVPDSKTDAGIRRIPLNEDALIAFRRLYQKALALGIADPSHFVFPSCQHGRLDPTRPQRTWRTSWRRLTTEAGLKGYRFHDLRHQCVTELAEGNVPEQVILSVAGHVSRRMLEHYSHIRTEAKRAALESLRPTIPAAQRGR